MKMSVVQLRWDGSDGYHFLLVVHLLLSWNIHVCNPFRCWGSAPTSWVKVWRIVMLVDEDQICHPDRSPLLSTSIQMVISLCECLLKSPSSMKFVSSVGTISPFFLVDPVTMETSIFFWMQQTVAWYVAAPSSCWSLPLHSNASPWSVAVGLSSFA